MKMTKKDWIKAVRTVLEIIFLLVLLVLVSRELFTFKSYKPYDPQTATGETTTGFVVISYFGVDRSGDDTLIGIRRLEEHLGTLYHQGYVTVTQEDILGYYKEGKPLPEKSLFLLFEDGRRDTAIFAQKILEKYNFKASMLSYAEKLDTNDPKFLLADQLLDLENSTFWELGTNGYRTAYINAYDRYDHYLGELTTLEFSMVNQYLGRNYNHYLMDYIRDEYHVPKESYQQMSKRISADYEGMQRVYTEKLGKLPGLYALMHSNTGRFGNNSKVSAVNEAWIYKLFDMNFNREGSCWNTSDSAVIYDLTRMQPQPYWYVNHLLMRIKYDSGLQTDFVVSDPDEFSNWNLIYGALECKPEKLILTSEPGKIGRSVLKDVTFRDGVVDLTMTGNKHGGQAVVLRGDENGENGICVLLSNNTLQIGEMTGDEFSASFELNLDDFDGIIHASVSEDEKNARIQELLARIRYASDADESAEYTRQLLEVQSWQTASVSDGEEAYIPDIDIREAGNRHLTIALNGTSMQVWIDGRVAVDHLEVGGAEAGSVALQTCWYGYGWSQTNIADDVYDGVFEKLTVTDADGAVLYENVLHGWDALCSKTAQVWNAVIDWFITYL